MDDSEGRRRRSEVDDREVEGLDSLDSQSGSQAFVADEQTSGSVLVDPTDFPATILALQRKERTQVDLVTNSYELANDDAHGKLESISLGAYALLNASLQQRLELSMEIRVTRCCEQPADAV